MPISVKIIKDSISESNKRITTFQLTYPRFIHAEMLTHRVFSRNASSSRAIPINKMIAMVHSDPAIPIHWGKNQPGMQANEQLTGYELEEAKNLWLAAASQAAAIAERMVATGLHKQVANRILEPFQHIHVVLTATEFTNWFELRAHPDAQPEIHELALQMLEVMGLSTPKLLQQSQWHLPYITEEEEATLGNETLLKVSAARCCRVSYLKHDGSTATIQEDLDLCNKLAGSIPIHASPFEHQAMPDPDNNYLELHGNLVGWIQHRKVFEHQFYK